MISVFDARYQAYLSPHAVTRPVCMFCRWYPVPPQMRLRWAKAMNVPDPKMEILLLFQVI